MSATIAAQFADPMWRLCNLYWIIDKSGKEVRFSPNSEQRRFLDEMWYRNTILKARQKGFSTLIQLLLLDYAVFTANWKGAVIAQTLTDCTRIFKDKIKFAYDRLPDQIKQVVYPITDSTTELELSNGSRISVGTSARGGTLGALHISEFGKICVAYPEKAREIVTGAIEAVAPEGLLFIESTAEGKAGYFFDYCQLDAKRQGALTPLDRRFHFYSWFTSPEYRIDPAAAQLSDEDNEYFDSVEAETGTTLDAAQRAWYVKKRESLGDDMKREYPSTPKEAFEGSMEGTYYRAAFTVLRNESRICAVPYTRGVPVNTFWDLGANDQNAIWLHQMVGVENRFIGYIEDREQTLDYYIGELQKLGYVWGKDYLPHDATHKRLSSNANKSIEEELWDLGRRDTVIVPRTQDLIAAINQTRQVLPMCWFDKDRCDLGLSRLENYRKKTDSQNGGFKGEPLHNADSNGADAFRQFAQAVQGNLITAPSSMQFNGYGRTGDTYAGY